MNYAGHPLHLTPKEYKLLELFLRNTHLVLSRSQILDHLWSFEDPPSEEAVKVHIKELRKKPESGGSFSRFNRDCIWFGLSTETKLTGCR